MFFFLETEMEIVHVALLPERGTTGRCEVKQQVWGFQILSHQTLPGTPCEWFSSITTQRSNLD